MPKVQNEREAEAMQKRILAAAKDEFARHGLGGARVDRIATRAKTNKRMLYHFIGNKEALFKRTLEDAYSAFRKAEAELHIEDDPPVVALSRLVSFTWNYYLANPEFITLVNSENLHKAKHLKTSSMLDELNKPFVMRMQELLQRGAKQGVFRPELDAVQMLITVAGVGFHYLNNKHTGAIVYGRDLMTASALENRGAFNVQAILRIACTPQTLMQLKEA